MASQIAAAVRRTATLSRVSSPSAPSLPVNLIQRREMGGSGDHHGPPKVNCWSDPMSPSKCKEEHVVEGATALYMEQLRGIQYITDCGAQQLSVDIKYLTSVLSALSMPIPSVLATFYTCFSTSKDQLKKLLKSPSTNGLDPPTANLVCKMA